MAGNSFSAELLISTTKANREMQAMNGQVQALDKSLANLGKTLAANQKNLDQTVKSIGAIVTASREASKASEEAAKAKLAEAKAQAEVSKGNNARNIAEATVAQKNSVVAVNQSTVAYKQARTEAVEFANSQRQVKSSTDDMGNSLANQRYLLYDVGATYRTLGLAAAALPTASIAAATAYEKSFAQVIRVSGETSTTAATLRDEIKALGTEIPLSFAELSNIAQIGGQMNIATEGLAGFTETVAKFVATADGATIESSTQAFGRLANLFNTSPDGSIIDPDFFERIGSAISYTADNAVTSEAKIVSMLEKIAPISAQFGFAETEVVGFASALSSVGMPPEISRGFLTGFFVNLTKNVNAGGEAIEGYNKILGTTGNQLAEMTRNNPAQVLQGVAEAMSKMSAAERTAAMDSIGVKGRRDIPVLAALSESYHVLEKAMDDTSEAYAKGSYLDQSSQGIFNTFAANLTKLSNSLTNLGDTLGTGTLPILNNLVGILQFLVDGANELASTSPAVKTFVTTLIGLGSVLGIIFALRSAAAFLTAGLVTLTHVTRQAEGGGLKLSAQLGNLSRAMMVNKGVSDQTSASLVRQLGAVKALGAAQALTATQMRALNVSLLSGNTAAKGFGAGIKGAGSTLLGLAGGPLGLAVTGLVALGGAWLNSAMDAKNSAQEMVRAAELGGEALAKTTATLLASDKVSLFSEGTNKFFDDNIGKSFQEVASQIGVGVDDIAEAMAGGKDSVDAYIANLERLKEGAPRELGNEYDIIIGKLKSFRDELALQETVAEGTKQAQEGITRSGVDMEAQVDANGVAFEDATDDVRNWASELNAAIEAAFGLTNAQAGLEASLERLGAGLAKDSSIGLGSEGGRANLASFQSVLSQQAALLQQSIQAGEISAQQAGQSFQQYAIGLIDQLNSMGVDTSGLMADVEKAIGAVQGTFAEQPATLSVDVDTNGAIDSATSALAWLGDYLDSNPQLATIGLTGEDEVSDKVFNLVSYISEATGMPFEAVVQAITNPAGEETENVVKFMQQAVGQDFIAYINADTSAGVQNVQNFASWTSAQLAELAQATAESVAVTGIGLGASLAPLMGFAKVLAAPAQVIAKANKVAAPSFAPLNRGYNDTAKAARDAGKAAGGAGKKAKKANDDTAKGSKNAAKAVKEQAKEWDELESQISGYASRVGTAFGYVTARQTGVAEAKDEYYSILNGIKERLEQQKQTVRDLRQENKALNAERRVQLNEAEKLEKMAGYADAMGNTERAKYYRDEAKALKESAKETANKISANTKEAKTIEKGIGNLKGYSKEAIENRKELRSLRDASLKVAEAYAASGASAKTVARETQNWTNKAKTHSKQLGYNAKDISTVTGRTNSYVTALKKVPKTVNTNLNAKNNTAGAVNSAKRSIGSVPSSRTTSLGAKTLGSYNRVKANLKKDFPTSKTVKVKVDAHLTPTAKRAHDLIQSPNMRWGGGPTAYNKGGEVKGYASGGLIPGTPPSDPLQDNIIATVDSKGIAAIRSGEYIQSQPAVDYYGSDIMDKLNRQEIPRYALGGQLGNRQSSGETGVSVIDLSAESIQSIARLVQKDIYLYADNQMLAQSVHKGNETIAQRGGIF